MNVVVKLKWGTIIWYLFQNTKFGISLRGERERERERERESVCVCVFCLICCSGLGLSGVDFIVGIA